VAYAFVPYGELLREHADYIMFAALAALFAGGVAGGGEALFELVPASLGKERKADRKGDETIAQVHARELAAHAQRERSRLFKALTVLAVVAAAAAATRIQPKPEPKVLGAPDDKVHFA